MSGTAAVAPLLAPVPGSDPSGPNLEYDAAYAELERLSVGKPEQQMGDQVIPAQDPDYRAVARQASELLGRTKDLRIGARLTHAWLRLEGWSGFAAGAELLRGLLETFWDTVHPQLDPDDGNDPTFRVNVFLALVDQGFLTDVRSAPLVEARGLGKFSLRDIAAANEPVPEGGTPPAVTADTINAAFGAADTQSLQGTLAVLTSARDHLRGIDAVFSDRAGGSGPDLSRLIVLVEQARKHVDKVLAGRAEDTAGATVGDGAGAEGGAVATVSAGGGKAGEIRTREDVVRMLDKLCDYYAKHEPSSPVPLLLKRAKRLVTASFLDIVKDIAPDSLAQFLLLSGREGEPESS